MKTKERTLENLRNGLRGTLHVYLRDAGTAERFYADAEEQGWSFGGIKPSDSPRDVIVALKDGKRLAHVGAMGRIAFQCGGGSGSRGAYHRIDYARYVRGDARYGYRGGKERCGRC